MAPTRSTPDETDRKDLTGLGQLINVSSCVAIIVRAVLTVMPFVYLLGADNWTILAFVIAYTFAFGILFLIYLSVFVISLARGEGAQKIFSESCISWNPLRHFYAAFIFTVVDYASNLIFWYVWLFRNNNYLDSPSNSNTPDPNAAGFFPFQMLCGAFIFSTVICLVFYFNLVRSLWSQKQALTKNSASATDQNLKVALGQLSASNKARFANIEIYRTAEKVNQNIRTVQAFTAFGALYYILIVVYLLIFFYHLFRDKTEMNYTTVTVFLWAAFFCWLVQIIAYYLGFGKGSVQTLVLDSAVDNDLVTAETNAEINAEMGTTFLCGFFLFFFNIIFAAYFYDLRSRPEFSWNSVPKFDPFVVIQSPLFYVWVTQAALNTGALCFIIYNAVTFAFICSRGGASTPEIGSNADRTQEEGGESDALLRGSDSDLPGTKKELEIKENRSHWTVILCISGMFAIWIVFYVFVVEAMVGGHWLAEWSFPITMTFSIVFFVLIIFIVVLAYMTTRELDDYSKSKTERFIEKFNGMNKSWYLAVYRNLVAVPVTYILQVIILSVTIYNYFEAKTFSDWECIRPIDPTTPPPYKSCNIYWAGAVLALYCTLLVYLVCIINAYANSSIKIMVIKQIKKSKKRLEQGITKNK